MKFLYPLCIVILLAICSSALKYIFVPENEDFFQDCPNEKSNVLNVNQAADMSHMTFTIHDDVILVSGNATYTWMIEVGDRIQASFTSLKYDRGMWQQTPYSMKIRDFVPALYDRNLDFYKYWTSHIINKDEIRHTMFYPGTILIHEPFDVNVTIESNGMPINGRYKFTTIIKAFDSNNVQRDTYVCFEVIGDVNRL
ncbi:PREDICTED: uncharacterized protein LOC108610241 [Drosophila arizonae]|uniref:Uncharacterized protein LOC108610241 n=1 Tax=Drosophila arizonae TaxID=7263 RepID=A0ABM1NRY2_DROAR|nr:PREDICTED: uncharacterized protein LOC108610241 [Drosophila arizonae]